MSAAPQGSRLHLRLFQKHRLTKSEICNRRIITTDFLLKWWYIKNNTNSKSHGYDFVKGKNHKCLVWNNSILHSLLNYERSICILLRIKRWHKVRIKIILNNIKDKYLFRKTNNQNIPQLVATYTDSDLNQTKHSIPKLCLKLNEIWIFYYTYQWSRS